MVCHGIPSERERLAVGDIVNVDLTTNVDGYHGDTSATLVIGEASKEAFHVVDVARRCRDAGIAVIRDGARLGDIGAAIQELARREGVRDDRQGDRARPKSGRSTRGTVLAHSSAGKCRESGSAAKATPSADAFVREPRLVKKNRPTARGSAYCFHSPSP